MHVLRLPMIAAALTGLASLPATAQQQERMDMKLADMGFVMRPADTPERMAKLQKLPPHVFLRRVKDGNTYYIYADPTNCKCIMIGNEQAMNSYRDLSNRGTPPPGYEEFAKSPGGRGRGGSTEGAMIQDMDSDGEIGMDTDFFQPAPF